MYKDWRGNEITVGCYVAYPTRVSSSSYIKDGIVEEIVPLTFEEMYPYSWNRPKDGPQKGWDRWAFKVKVRKLEETDIWTGPKAKRIWDEAKGKYIDNPNYVPKYSLVSTIDVTRITVVGPRGDMKEGN